MLFPIFCLFLCHCHLTNLVIFLTPFLISGYDPVKLKSRHTEYNNCNYQYNIAYQSSFPCRLFLFPFTSAAGTVGSFCILIPHCRPLFRYWFSSSSMIMFPFAHFYPPSLHPPCKLAPPGVSLAGFRPMPGFLSPHPPCKLAPSGGLARGLSPYRNARRPNCMQACICPSCISAWLNAYADIIPHSRRGLLLFYIFLMGSLLTLTMVSVSFLYRRMIIS